jgi:hypothetical protein
VKKSDSRYLRAAFAAWKLEIDWQKLKKRDDIRATAWHKKSIMLRAFKAWGRNHAFDAKAKRLGKSAVIILQRHQLKRCWYSLQFVVFGWICKDKIVYFLGLTLRDFAYSHVNSEYTVVQYCHV